jgi:uncharacterized LabA/DUF88 family protein
MRLRRGGSVQRVAAYVDGFNLYHGMHQRFGRSYHWLDLEKLALALLRDGQQLECVRYFTARVRGTEAGRLRQVNYLEALTAHCSTLKIIEGRFQQKTMTCHSCRREWAAYEEKESDVNIAVTMVEDAAEDVYDAALIISADSDLCPAVRAVRRIRPDVRLTAAFPPRRHSDALSRAVERTLHVDRAMLRRSQLPDEVVTANGTKLSRPAYWN